MELDIGFPLPERKDYRLGILGSGVLARECHLPAYRKAGFNPTAIASRNPEHAAEAAHSFQVPRVFAGAQQLLDDSTLEVLDLAVPPHAHLELIRAACERQTAKAILAQLPLGRNCSEAKQAVALCERAGILLGVDHSMRYEASVRAAGKLVAQGTLGDPVFATLELRGPPHWREWQQRLSSLTLRSISVHHLDAFRFWFGDPARVYCSTRPDPRTKFEHRDGICTYILEYAGGLRCVGVDDVWAGPVTEGCPGESYLRWRIEGSIGLALGELGWGTQERSTPSAIRYGVKCQNHFQCPVWPESWHPDAFVGPMAQLLVALERRHPPANSGRDALRTIALVEAAQLSSLQSKAIGIEEIELEPAAQTEPRCERAAARKA